MNWVFDISSIDAGDFYVKFHLKNREDDFQWILVAVYGAAQIQFKEKFLTELVHACRKDSLPILIGGDFNIIRHAGEKNKDNFEYRWPFLFNAVINNLDLREIDLSGRQFTWANSLDNPTYEKLDGVLMSTDWEHIFPLVTVNALERSLSYHTPLLLNTRAASYRGSQPLFKFELGWLCREGFREMVAHVWNKEIRSQSALQSWQCKVRSLRQFLQQSI